MDDSYLLGELVGRVLITYAIYWVTKKLVIKKVKRDVTQTEKVLVVIFAIVVQFLLILQSALRR